MTDILVLALFFRAFLVGQKSGVIAEIFCLLGVFCATFVSIQYYVVFGEFLRKSISFPEPLSQIFAFVILVTLVTILFALAQKGWQILLVIKFPAVIDRWGGLVFALVRTYLVCGLVVLGFYLMPAGMEFRVRKSFGGSFFKEISYTVYKNIYDGLVANLLPEEPLNTQILSDIGLRSLQDEFKDDPPEEVKDN